MPFWTDRHIAAESYLILSKEPPGEIAWSAALRSASRAGRSNGSRGSSRVIGGTGHPFRRVSRRERLSPQAILPSRQVRRRRRRPDLVGDETQRAMGVRRSGDARTITIDTSRFALNMTPIHERSYDVRRKASYRDEGLAVG